MLLVGLIELWTQDVSGTHMDTYSHVRAMDQHSGIALLAT